MTHQEKVNRVKVLINDSSITNEVIESYLEQAEYKIKQTLSPYKAIAKIPAQYDLLHCELASRYIFRRGIEGQKISNENGIVRTFGSVDDSDLLSNIVPYVGV